MPRSFYLLALTLNILAVIGATVAAALFSVLGSWMFYLSIYPTWILFTLLFSTVSSIVMLKYFWSKDYKVSFWLGVLYYSALTFFIFLSYSSLSLAFGGTLIIPSQLLAYLLQTVFCASFLFSASKERRWMRISGAYGILFALVVIVLVSIIASGNSVELNLMIEKLQGSIYWAGVPLPLMTAINFYDEWQRETIDTPKPFFAYASFLSNIIAAVAVIALVSGGLEMKKYLPEMDKALMKVAEPFEARSYVNNEGDTLKYRFLKPVDFDPSRSYPIVVCLHGSSGTGNDNYRQVAGSLFPEFLTHGTNLKNFQAFIFVPQCPFGTSWGGTALPAIDEIVFETMESLEKEFNIDSTRRYVAGGSLGGYGAWHFIESHPELFAAAVPLCGAGNPANASKCADVPVWAFHGVHDERVPVSGSRNMIKAMEAAGGHPRYTEFPNASHDISKLVVETPGLLEWLFAQQRKDL